MRKGTYTHIVMAALAVAIIGILFILINVTLIHPLGITLNNKTSSTISSNTTILNLTMFYNCIINIPNNPSKVQISNLVNAAMNGTKVIKQCSLIALKGYGAVMTLKVDNTSFNLNISTLIKHLTIINSTKTINNCFNIPSNPSKSLILKFVNAAVNGTGAIKNCAQAALNAYGVIIILKVDNTTFNLNTKILINQSIPNNSIDQCFNIPSNPSKSLILKFVNAAVNGTGAIKNCAQAALNAYGYKVLEKYNITINIKGLNESSRNGGP